MSTRRRIQLAVLTLAAFGISWGVAWYVVRDRVQQSHEYLLTADRVDLTPLPPWIHSDIKTEVLGSASLDGPLSILDPNLTQRLHDAFPLHPWVQRVVRVTKQYPARVKVELQYRRPVCMVEVPGGLFAVDAESVLLPSGDFSPNEASRYPRLSQVPTIPLGQVGTHWGDPRVAGGSRLAALLLETWNHLRLARIVPSPQPLDEAGEVFSYELQTLQGTKIIWGRPPGADPAGEPAPESKLARLQQLADQHGSLDSAGAIDLRMPGTWQSSTRTAQKPEPAPQAPGSRP